MIERVIPTIDYPEEAIEQEDWLNVYNTFASNRFDAEDASKEITKGGGVRLPIPWPLMTIFYMVPYTMTTFVNFSKKMELKGRIGEGWSSGRLLVLHEEKMFVEITEGRTNFNKKHNLGRLDGFLFPPSSAIQNLNGSFIF
ncbi:hypothetical protein J32TS2_09480 [Shouchella clausii]|uniref:hypothetical protein n=1 Tax=Shouchella clausii TaxID=79880 RepID=UPI001B2426EC|nr:hypothetical protein J1TS1_30060 [Shouchella clausii]GIN15592.1 hypothetical protein J32TS2_09480 [Shouchella clausii]